MHFYNVQDGSEMFQYNETLSIEYENSICKVFFLDKGKINLRTLQTNGDDDNIDCVVFTISYFGILNVFTISFDNEINKIYTHSMLSVVKNGIYCAELDSMQQYLYLGSFVSNSYSDNKYNSNGIYILRVLNCEPWLKHVEINNDFDAINTHKIKVE